MRRRLRAWLGETHGVRFEMARHFGARFFDSEMFTTQGQWVKVAIGVASGLVPLAILLLPMFWHRYGCLNMGQPALACPAIDDYRAEYIKLVRSDMAWIVGLAMCATALVTAIEWQALFPTRRDRLALASLPVSARDLFVGKAGAVAAGFAGFALAMAMLPAGLFAIVIQGRWQENPSFAANFAAILAAACAASAFVFFSLLAFQGILLSVLPPRLFSRITVYVQAAVFILSLAALPFLWPDPGAAVSPPVSWFLGLWAAGIGAPDGAARNALLATGLAAAMASVGYLVSYGRYQRWMLESPADGARSRRLAPFGSRLLERWVGDPREQAMFAFIWKTLTRSRTHRLVLLLYAGLGLAWMTKGLAEHAGAAPADAAGFEFAAAFLPLTAAVFALLTLRYLFSLPSELPANWIFRITESEGREAWLRAVDRFAVWCGLGPIYLCGAPAAMAVFGWFQGARMSLLSFALALLVFEALFRNWRKAPFTCSYAPGKRPIWQVLTFAFVALSCVAAATGVAVLLSQSVVTFVASFPLLLSLWWKARKKRRALSDIGLGLIYDDLPEPAVSPLRFEYDPGLQAPLETADEASPAAARYGSIFRVPEEVPDDRALAPFFDPRGLFDDFRHALRGIRKNAALSAAVVGTLALGIGMNVAVFTLIDGFMLRPRVPDPDTFARVSPSYAGLGMAAAGRVTDAEYRIYRAGSRSLLSLAAWRPGSVTLGRDRSNAADALYVSCNFFSVYGLEQPLLGRLLQPGDCDSAGAVAVIGEEAWRRQFGADPGLVGKLVRVNGQAFTVLGIAPAGCAARIHATSVWLPYTTLPLVEPRMDASVPWLILEGRLAPGFSRGAAQAEMRVIASRLDRMNPGRKTTLTVTDGSWLAVAGLNGFHVKSVLWLLAAILGSLGMMLLMTCVNVTTLLLSRAVSRRREVALRLALGAPRARLLRMLFVESLLLTAAAGCIGLFVAGMAPEPLYRFLTKEAPDFSLAPDWRIAGYILGLVFAAACLSGLTPAFESLRVDLASALKGYETTCGGPAGHWRFRNLLVSAQVAMALALLAAAGMFGRAFFETYLTSPGLETRQVLVVPLRFPPAARDAARGTVLDLAGRIRSLPGVRSVAYANGVPLTDRRSANAVVPAIDSSPSLDLRSASPGYFETLGIPILRGRSFRESDSRAGGGVAQAVVSESLARTIWPGQDPLGKRLLLASGQYLDIAGVARNVSSPLSDSPVAYVLDDPNTSETNLLVRWVGDPRAAARAIQAAVRAADPDFLVTARPLQAWIDDQVSVFLRIGSFVWTIGVVAWVLAIVGIYGVVSFEVSQRTKEIGIRAALGAKRLDILREVLVSGGKPVVAGLFAGLWLSLAAGAVLQHEVLDAPAGIGAGGAAVYLGTALLLAIAALAAISVSASRGSQVDPMEALRQE